MIYQNFYLLAKVICPFRLSFMTLADKAVLAL